MKEQPKYGQVWRTRAGHRVRIMAGRNREVIETMYVDGRVAGRLGANFDALTGKSILGDDELMEREA